MQPKINYNRIWGLYYFVYGVLAHFFLINIIIAILVEKYIVAKQKLGNFFILGNIIKIGNFIEKLNLLNYFQKEWRTIKHLIMRMKPKKKVKNIYVKAYIYIFF